MRIEPSEKVDEIAHAVIGAAIDVHRSLGPGFTEMVYENALCIELEFRGLRHARQVRVPLRPRGEDVGIQILDVLVEDLVIVELKAIEQVAPVHRAQVLSYLRATGHRIGLLINFNVPCLRDGVRRIINASTKPAGRTP